MEKSKENMDLIIQTVRKHLPGDGWTKFTIRVIASSQTSSDPDISIDYYDASGTKIPVDPKSLSKPPFFIPELLFLVKSLRAEMYETSPIRGAWVRCELEYNSDDRLTKAFAYSDKEDIAVSSIFDIRPMQWGLRGDPFLWDEMQKHFNDKKLPYPQEQFRKDFYSLFESISGDALGSKKTTFAKRYAKTGMSAGQLHHGFWIETALPLLLRRLELVNKSCTE